MRCDGVPEDPALEDIHMHVEHRLAELIGPAAGRLHTARSRNDQVATDFKLWVRDAIDAAEAGLAALQRALVTRAAEHAATVMPGFTHLQSAQPVTLGHHLMAYYEMLRRDRSRFADARARLNECPLGAAALAGTGFPIDREATALALDFDRPDRQFARRGVGPGFRARLSDGRVAMRAPSVAPRRGVRARGRARCSASSPFPTAFSTGSSIMPQKRNPDAAELVRGHAGRIAGAMVALW